MKYYVKRGIEIVAILLMTALVTFAFGNRHSLANRFHDYTMKYWEAEELVLNNWNATTDGRYHSQEDPQIVIYGVDSYVNNVQVEASMDLIQDDSDEVRIYYTDKLGVDFDSENVLVFKVDKSKGIMEFSIEKDVYDLRIDLSEFSDTQLLLKDITINPRNFSLDFMDYLLWGIMLLGMGVIFHFRGLFYDLYERRELLKTLVRNDLKSRYAGSFFGLVWAFVQPIMTILVFWLVYELGFRTLPVNNVKFILWFIPAYIPWVFFSDAITNTSNCLREYSYLVKKMKFKVEMLPVIKVFTSLVIHSFFVTFMIFIYAFYKYQLPRMTIQLIYYSIALLFLLMGLGWLTSAIAVFMKDFTQMISIILQIGFFVIPIFWNDADMSPKVLFFLKLNPVFYIVQGYRDSLINKICFWDKPILTAYYWIITLFIFFMGVTLFRKTSKHFADLI